MYYNNRGTGKVILDPSLVVFQWSSWCVFGYNHEKRDFKMFKLNRLWELHITERTFQIQDIPEEKFNFNSYFTDDIQAIILFDSYMKYHLIETYGIDCYTELNDSRLKFEFPFTNKDFPLSWVLSFDGNAELIELKEIRAG